jgi:hypothetical protein
MAVSSVTRAPLAAVLPARRGRAAPPQRPACPAPRVADSPHAHAARARAAPSAAQPRSPPPPRRAAAAATMLVDTFRVDSPNVRYDDEHITATYKCARHARARGRAARRARRNQDSEGHSTPRVRLRARAALSRARTPRLARPRARARARRVITTAHVR